MLDRDGQGQSREEYVRAPDKEKTRAKEAEVAAWNWTPEKARRFLDLWLLSEKG